MEPADRERIEAIKAQAENEWTVGSNDALWLLSQLSALTEALTAAQQEAGDWRLSFETTNEAVGKIEVALSACQQERETATIAALKNSGVDVNCGACMEVAFTGLTQAEHTCQPSAALTACRAQGEAKQRIIVHFESMYGVSAYLTLPDAQRAALSSTPKEPANG